MRRTLTPLLVLCAALVLALPRTPSPRIGEDRPRGGVSGGSAASGEAIKRGIQIAMDEVNAKGGVLGGRKLELVIPRRRGQPSQGVTIAREADRAREDRHCLRGLHTTVALAQVPVWLELKTPYMGAWAAAPTSPATARNPNYVFRVSANDDYADRFLTRYTVDTLKKGKPGLLLENTAWGQSNEVGLLKWLGERRNQTRRTDKFNWTTRT